MKRIVFVLTLAVAICFVLPSVVQADPNDPVTESWANQHLTTQKWSKNKQHNSKKAAAIPTWKITQDGTNLSVDWVDATNPRFAVYDCGIPGVLSDDIVLDKETGLVWARQTTQVGDHDWEQATLCSRVATLGNRKGWRLPTVEELSSLLDMSGPGTDGTMLPEGHPFLNVQLEDRSVVSG